MYISFSGYQTISLFALTGYEVFSLALFLVSATEYYYMIIITLRCGRAFVLDIFVGCIS